jgi:glyoxylase-like metal-dependent hydrolase (beta-lactamase superfamily II)
MTKRLNWVLAALLVLFGLPYYWLLLDNRVGDARPKPITITQLRQAAATMPGPAPTDVEVEMVAFGRLPGNLMVAGSGMKRKLSGMMAWRLPVPRAGPIMIDSGITEAGARIAMVEKFDAKKQERVEKALDEAGMILITHEHLDHLGPLAAREGPALRAKAWLNPGQLPPSPIASTLLWAKGPLPAPRIVGDQPRAVAPGVVVIPAPSHTPGSQLIFVRLADGREFLFAGDIASFAQNWQEIRARSQLVSRWFGPEDRGEVYSWLLTIKALKQAAPALKVIPGHDFEWLANPFNNSGVKVGYGSARH